MLASLLTGLSGFLAGILIGQSVNLFHDDPDECGTQHWRVRMNLRWVRSRWVLLVMIILFAVSSVQLVYYTYHQRTCNAQFQAALLVNSQISQEDRDIERRDDELRDKLDEVDSTFYRSLITPPPIGVTPQAYTRSIIEAHIQAQEVLQQERRMLRDERNELEQRRRDNPFPPISC